MFGRHRQFKEVNPDTFVAPDFSAAFDVAEYIATIPEDAKIRGMFFNNIVKSAGPQVDVALRIPFKNYPATAFVELMRDLAAAVHSDTPLPLAFRRFGHSAFNEFATTVVGRALLAASFLDFHDVLTLAPRAYALAGTLAQAVYSPVDDHAGVIALRGCFDVPNFHEVGVFEGVLAAHNENGTVRVKRFGLGDVDLLIEWAKADQ